ncbi:MAG: ABC transporter ATP-binding protein [Acidimicrobiales bacterium]
MNAGWDSIRQAPRLIGKGFAMVRRSGLRLPIAFGVLDLVSGLLVAVELLLIHRVTDTFLSDNETVAVGALVMFGVVTATRRLLGSASRQLQVIATERIEYSLVHDVLSVATLAPFERFEDPSYRDRLVRALGAAQIQAWNTMHSVLQVTNATVASASLVAVMATIAPELLLPFAIAGALLVAVAVLQSRLRYEFQFVNTPLDRERMYLRSAMTSREEGKEARLFGSRRLLMDRHEELQAQRMADLVRMVKRQLASDVMGSLTLAVALVGVFIVIAVRAGDGAIGVADAAVAAVAAQQLSGRIQAVVTGLGSLHQATLFLNDLVEFIDDPPEVPPDPPSLPPQPTAIVLDGVSYAYPDAQREAVTDVTIRIEAGEVVAVVGENGAGKSTVAKLLAGLYTPTEGTVRLEGLPADGAGGNGSRPHDGTVDQVVDGPLTGIVSAVFQDFARYELTVSENVWLGAPWREADDAAIAEALAVSGADAMLRDLPDGLDARLGRQFAGGLDLSLGQWQRLALARAFFSPAGFLILDEPTASLDPRVEADLFDRLHELSKGRGVLLISHRYSTVKSADRIVVMDRGQVAEMGTHDELMAAQGLYATLYGLQADRYRV